MALYAKAMQQVALSEQQAKAAISNVQQVLIALQEKNLVWRASRGVYAVDEPVTVELLQAAGMLEGLD